MPPRLLQSVFVPKNTMRMLRTADIPSVSRILFCTVMANDALVFDKHCTYFCPVTITTVLRILWYLTRPYCHKMCQHRCRQERIYF
jgi:hypothetical protein